MSESSSAPLDCGGSSPKSDCRIFIRHLLRTPSLRERNFRHARTWVLEVLGLADHLGGRSGKPQFHSAQYWLVVHNQCLLRHLHVFPPPTPGRGPLLGPDGGFAMSGSAPPHTRGREISFLPHNNPGNPFVPEAPAPNNAAYGLKGGGRENFAHPTNCRGPIASVSHSLVTRKFIYSEGPISFFRAENLHIYPLPSTHSAPIFYPLSPFLCRRRPSVHEDLTAPTSSSKAREPAARPVTPRPRCPKRPRVPLP